VKEVIEETIGGTTDNYVWTKPGKWPKSGLYIGVDYEIATVVFFHKSGKRVPGHFNTQHCRASLSWPAIANKRSYISPSGSKVVINKNEMNVGVWCDILTNHCRPGDHIFDGFCGSGPLALGGWCKACHVTAVDIRITQVRSTYNRMAECIQDQVNNPDKFHPDNYILYPKDAEEDAVDSEGPSDADDEGEQPEAQVLEEAIDALRNEIVFKPVPTQFGGLAGFGFKPVPKGLGDDVSSSSAEAAALAKESEAAEASAKATAAVQPSPLSMEEILGGWDDETHARLASAEQQELGDEGDESQSANRGTTYTMSYMFSNIWYTFMTHTLYMRICNTVRILS
jgi:hypothetical protein